MMRDLVLAAALLAVTWVALVVMRLRRRRSWREIAHQLGLAHRVRSLLDLGVIEGVRGDLEIRIDSDATVIDLWDRFRYTIAWFRSPSALPDSLRLVGARARGPLAFEIDTQDAVFAAAWRVAGSDVGPLLSPEVRRRLTELAAAPVIRDAAYVEVRGSELNLTTRGLSSRHLVAIIETGCSLLAALSPSSLIEGTRYRVRCAFHAAGRDVPGGQVLRFEERIYNREDGSWLFRFSSPDGDVWLIEQDPAGIQVLRALDAFLEVADPADREPDGV